MSGYYSEKFFTFSGYKEIVRKDGDLVETKEVVKLLNDRESLSERLKELQECFDECYTEMCKRYDDIEILSAENKTLQECYDKLLGEKCKVIADKSDAEIIAQLGRYKEKL
tara:strand:+ start:1256 stop:1588 length:333 start_codon:yes stop_codon:yes gene_type:complete